MRRALLFTAGCLLLSSASLLACSQGSADAPAPVSAATIEPGSPAPALAVEPSRARGAVIGTVVTHDARISILSRSGDLRVVVRKSDGAMIADGISIDELRTVDPTLHAIVTNATASTPGTYVDATLDHPQRGELQPSDHQGRPGR